MAENKDKKVLNVPNIRFKEFKEEWEKCRLDKVATIVGGGTPDTNNSVFWNGSIQWFTPSEVGKNKYISHSIRKISEEGLKKSSAKLLPIGTILLSSRATIGECSINTIECTTNQGFESLIINQDNYNEFFFYLIQTKRKELIRKSCGSTFLEISSNEIKKINITKPSRKEQEKIARFLSLIDERIATQNKIIDKLESLIKGISRKLLDEEEGHYVSLENILKERIEKTTINNQYEVLSSTVNGIFVQREYFSREIASSNNVGYKVLRLNDIVLSPQNLWMGNINYNKSFNIGIVSPSYKIFSITDSYDKDFIAALLKTKRALYNYALASEQGASIVRRNLNIEAFKQIVFKLPSYKKQCQIGKTISLLEKSLENNMKLKNSYELQKTYLLRQMFI